jgi:diacylglycerol O-acyltransferase / wax synthase
MAGAVITRLNAQDAQILRREAGPVRGHSAKVLVLARSAGYALPTVADLQAAIAARLDSAPRLRQRLVQTPLRLVRPGWADDPEFDIARHVTAVPADGPVGRADLERIVAGLMARRLDRSRPLWHIDVVPELADGSMALIWRLHHCMADGATAMALATAVLWRPEPTDNTAPADGPGPADESGPARPWIPAPQPGTGELLLAGLRERGRQLVRLRPRPGIGTLLAGRAAATRELSRTAAVTALAGRAGPDRCAALVQVPLATCKLAGKAICEQATVNDVLLAIVAGGLRAWLARRRDPARGIRVQVPVSLHQPGEHGAVANRDSYFFADLPVAEPDPAERVRAICRQTAERKRGRDADALYELGLVPAVARWAMSPRVFTVNVSNVRGPAHPVYVLGGRVRELYALSEIAQGHALRIAAISSSDTLSIGLLADSAVVTDLPDLAADIRQATTEILAHAAAAASAAG